MAAPIDTQAVTKQTNGQYLVASRSQPGLVHVVRKVRAGFQCDCEAAVNGVNCWHVASVVQIVNEDSRWEKARKQAGIENARRIVLNRMMGRPDDYLMRA